MQKKNDSQKDKKKKKYRGGFIVGTAFAWCILHYKEIVDVYINCIAPPQWNLYHEIGKDVISVDNVELINGKMVVCPTICIYIDKNLTDIILLSQYYNHNIAVIEKNKNENIHEFVFEVDEEQREKVEDIIAQIKEYTVGQDTDIEVHYFVQVTFKSDIFLRSGYDEFCIIPGNIRRITSDEKKSWDSRYIINMDDYEIDSFEKKEIIIKIMEHSC